MTYRVLDLFSGIGGFSLGLERTGGFKTCRFVERDAYCQRVLAARFGDVPCDDDVTTAEFSEGEADVITGGFPCQDLSLAGRGAGLAGERSGLYRELVRAIRLVRPRYAIVENVAALLGRGMGTVLGDLAEIGHDAEWHCIPASAVGAPHRRDRVWIVAHPEHDGRDEPALGRGALACEEQGRVFELEGHRAAAASLADAVSARLEGRAPLAGHLADELAAIERGGEVPPLPDSDGEGRAQSSWAGEALSRGRAREPSGPHGGGWDQWLTEPDVGRVAHGVPSRVDRLRALGNAVVPQIPELIGRAILQAEREARR